MATLAEQIPKELLAAEKKAEVIEYIRASRLPSRFRRRLLQEWGQAVDVELTGEDYQAILGGQRAYL